MLQTYGFVASPDLSSRHNAAIRMAALPSFEYWNRPSNQAFHNLTTLLSPPPNLKSLLGLGLKFIPTPFRPTTFNQLNQIGAGLPYIERSLRLRCFFCAVGYPRTDVEFNPKLHIPSNWTPPEEYFPKILGPRLFQFAIRLRKLFRGHTSIPNLSRTHRSSLDYLRSQKDFLVVNCDKNLGPAIIERDRYIRLAFRDHLLDSSTYLRLTPFEARAQTAENKLRLGKWLEDHEEELNDQEHAYIKYHLSKVTDPLPYFYLLMKIHKTPLKTRPIVSFSGSLFHAIGVWIDTHLQAVAKSFPSYLQSSFDLLRDFDTLDLPVNCRIFTADATSMYTNIDTDAAISAIHDYIRNNQQLFPFLPLTPLIEALEMLMKRNIFQFGDTFWKQLTGTAMGAPPAPTYANVSFATHELDILDRFCDSLAYYKRYIDDVFGVWISHPDPVVDARLWHHFQQYLNGWHNLQWVVSERTDEVVFLDLTIRLQGTSLKSTLFEKPMNLHLYLPARSAHPPGVLYGLISGSIYRAFSLCSDPLDAQSYVQKMWRYLRSRGYTMTHLRPLFLKALQLRQTYTPPPPDSDLPPDLWFFKLTYHPQDPPSHLIQQAWRETIATPRFSKPLHEVDVKYTKIGDRRFIVCYRRHPNLGNLLSYRKLKPNSGLPVSSFTE